MEIQNSINELKESDKALEGSNKQLVDSNKVLSYKVDIQAGEISNLKLENENLVKKLFSLYEDLNK